MLWSGRKLNHKSGHGLAGVAIRNNDKMTVCPLLRVGYTRMTPPAILNSQSPGVFLFDQARRAAGISITQRGKAWHRQKTERMDKAVQGGYYAACLRERVERP